MYHTKTVDVHAGWLPDNESPRKIPDFLRQAAGVAVVQGSPDRAQEIINIEGGEAPKDGVQRTYTAAVEQRALRFDGVNIKCATAGQAGFEGVSEGQGKVFEQQDLSSEIWITETSGTTSDVRLRSHTTRQKLDS